MSQELVLLGKEKELLEKEQTVMVLREEVGWRHTLPPALPLRFSH